MSDKPQVSKPKPALASPIGIQSAVIGPPAATPPPPPAGAESGVTAPSPVPSLADELERVGIAAVVRAAVRYIHEVYHGAGDWVAAEETLRRAVDALPPEVRNAALGVWTAEDLARADEYAVRVAAMFREGQP